MAINFLRREEEQVGLTIKRRLAFSEMDSRGLTSLEEGGGVKKSQWSLWEQADKISGIGVIMMVSSINEDEDMKVCS